MTDKLAQLLTQNIIKDKDFFKKLLETEYNLIYQPHSDNDTINISKKKSRKKYILIRSDNQ